MKEKLHYPSNTGFLNLKKGMFLRIHSTCLIVICPLKGITLLLSQEYEENHWF